MTTAPAQPHLILVKDEPTAPVEGVVVPAETAPAWIWSETRAARALAPAIAGRGFARIARSLYAHYRDDWPHMIATAEAYRAASTDIDEQDQLTEVVNQRRRAYRTHRLKVAGVTGAWTSVGMVSAGLGILTGSLWVDLVIAAGLWGWGAWRGRGDEPQPLVLQPGTEATAAVAQAAVDGQPIDTEAVDEPELRKALAALGFPRVTIVDNPPARPDGTRTVTFDLGGTNTVTELRKKVEGLAAALGRDLSMVDIDKIPGNAGRASLWTASTDPFETARPTPLLDQHTPLDSWRDGIPIAYNKRGIAIRIALTNKSAVIGGRSRSGKGVGASNLIAGAAMDPLVNLRIVAGKHNAEWDPYAQAGIASTYFKPSPQRLLALLQALLADKDRRERDLGRLGKSKLIHSLIHEVGGIEVLVIDELATYTRPGKPLRDEILAAIEELSQVALGAGILLVLITQYPEVDVLPQGVSMNCGIKWAMCVENASQSNAILGAGQAGAGRDASKFDPPRAGLGWLVDPFAGVTDLARSFDLDEDERGEISLLLQRAAEFRRTAGRLAGQWDDPIEKHLLNATGLSSAAGGPQRDGVPGRSVAQLTGEQRIQLEAIRGALAAMTLLGRDAATLDEMAEIIGDTMTRDRLGDLLRAAGAGGADKVKIGDKWPRGYKRADLEDAERFLTGA